MVHVAVEEICQEWKDDKRMNALFAPVGDKNLNPESWKAKIKFWIDLIEEWSLKNDIILLDISALKKVFIRNGKSPYCLEDVIAEACKSGQFCATDEYLKNVAASHQSWGAWMLGAGAGAIKKVSTNLIWKSETGSFTVLQVLQREKLKIQSNLESEESYISSRQASIFTHKQISQLLEESYSDIASREYVLKVLFADKILIKFEVEHETFYKFVPHQNKKEVNEIDQGLVKLKQTLQHLQDRISELVNKLSKEKERLKGLLRDGARNSAKTCLKRIKRYEQNHDKLMNQQLSLDQLYDELISAETNAILMEAYSTGLTTLKSLVNDDMLEKSENTMTELAQILDTKKEIDEALVFKDEILDSELDDELKELLENESEENGYTAADNNPIKLAATTSSDSFEAALVDLDRLEVIDLEPEIETVEENKVKAYAS